jgi:hypothetical protein
MNFAAGFKGAHVLEMMLQRYGGPDGFAWSDLPLRPEVARILRDVVRVAERRLDDFLYSGERREREEHFRSVLAQVSTVPIASSCLASVASLCAVPLAGPTAAVRAVVSSRAVVVSSRAVVVSSRVEGP